MFVPPTPHGMIAPASNAISAHYSFDFAQQVRYPSNPLQPGPIYFLRPPSKAAIFGVCCEAIPRQVNFIIDEASDTGKGANTVVSLLDFFPAIMASAKPPPVCMLTTAVARTEITPWCSTSCGECSQVCTKPSVHHFMITGHTKFSTDACFGLLKRKFRRTDVSSLDNLARVVEESAACNICQLVGAQDGSTIVPSRDWAGFLSSHFRRLDGIKQYHHFRFERDHPGVVFLKKTATAEEEQRVLLRGVWLPSYVDKPPPIAPTGLSLERQRYLVDKIREYCREDVRDLVCPDPGTTKQSSTNITIEMPSKRRRT